MTTPTIAFIGGGNMAASLIGGLVADGWDADRIRVADPDGSRRERLASSHGVHTASDNCTTAAGADIVVLAVKPQALKAVCDEIAATIGGRSALVISIAAGIREPDLRRWLGAGTAIVRTMPNTPALVQTGATGLYANPQVSGPQREMAETVMRAVGLALWVEDEALLAAVTALSGSGPAYHFLFMEALEEAGIQLGLSAEPARLLSLQTALGAAKMALESSDSTAVLRRRVTSPGGTTERALAVLEDGRLRELVARALAAAAERARELGDELGGQ